MKPIVDGLEKSWRAACRVIRLNVQDPVGKALAGELGFRMTPTFVFSTRKGPKPGAKSGGWMRRG